MLWGILSLPFYNLGTTVVFLITLYLSYWYVRSSRYGKMPPGPPALPIIGSLPWMTGSDIREVFHEMSGRYGKIFSIYLGGRRTVVLCDREIIRDAFIKHSQSFIDRPQDLFFIEEITQGSGVVSSNGKVWRDQRAFIHNVFRDFGVGSSILEEKILEEAGPMIEALTSGKQPINPHLIIQPAVANIITSITFGRRYEYDDPKFIKYMKIMTDNFEILGNAGALTIFPSLKYLPGDLFKYKRLRNGSDYMKMQFRENVDSHRETHEPGLMRSLIDAYLTQIDETKDDPESNFHEEQLVNVIGDLFGAGTETTATTLIWGIVYMLRNPDVYRTVQKEVDDVIGSSRLPSVKDKLNMPYTEACLLEIQRMGDIVPLGVPRMTSETMTFHGFQIPQGTTIMPSLYSVHRDPKVFPEPYTFDPSRFLNSEGKVCDREKVIPFSIGKRNCLGESLAKMELFLMFTSLMQHVEIKLPEGCPLPEPTGIISITHAAKPYKAHFMRR